MTMTPQSLIESARRIVVKISSALVTDERSGAARENWLRSLAADIESIAGNKEIVIVSSGAVALGRAALGLTWGECTASIPLALKQAAAAVGQVTLSRIYAEAFASQGLKTGMILLTPRDTEDRRAHLNARATINMLLEKGIIPVINENDTVSTAQLRFGDNDRLAARVAQMIDADLVIQLSTIDGLYTADPRRDSSAVHIPLIGTLSDEHFGMAGDSLPGVTTGGMKSKLEAARLAAGAGIPMMIAKGVKNNPLREIGRATIFKAAASKASARKKWIQGHVHPAGSMVLDEGACRALKSGKSLLPAGVRHIDGVFECGDPVAIVDDSGRRLGIGLSAYSSEDAVRIAGRRSTDIPQILGYARGDEMIHRDDLALN